MSNITDWLKYELYPALFERIDTALPEHDFKRYSGGWRSKTYLDGRPHSSRADKTVVTSRAPGLILEQGGEILSLVDYVMSRDGVEFISAVRTLAERVGLDVPKGDYDQEAYQRNRDQATLMADCNSYFTYCLQTSPGAEGVRSHLASRGYSGADIEAMELGYIPDQGKLITYLLGKGYSQSLIDEHLRLNKGIGTSHRLTIPYRSGGSIKGFKFRTVSGAEPKYLNSTGLDRSGGFFNLSALKGDKDVVIVEGELDSLSATARGIENVVATGGSSVIPDQVKDAIRRGAKSFTLCLDTEPGKEEETDKRINSAIAVILAEGVNRVYVVTLPDLGDGKTDPDRMIKELGVDAFREAVKGAIEYYRYQLQQTLTRYGKIQEERGLYPREIDSLLEEVVATSAKIPEPIDRDRFKRLFTELEAVRELGITEESLSLTVDRLTTTKAKETQAKELGRLLTDATLLQHRGDTDGALEQLESKVKEIRIAGARDLLPAPLNFDSLLDEIATLPPAYKTGYSSLDKFVGFTPGAITLVAGRPSHGKTTFMFNLLLQMSGRYQGETFYLFTYEEPVKNISIKLLNRLTATDLSGYFRDVRDLPTPTNYEFIKSYIRARRTDIPQVEEGKRLLRDLIDSQRLKVIDRNYSVEELASLIPYLQKKERIGALFIDYIQRMRTERRTQDKRTEIAHISDSVLQIAKESGLPITLGAQLNRATQDSKEGKPRLENLKEAGNLEEDANTVLSVYNESREKGETAEGETYQGMREVDLEIKALKNREGEVNQTATLIFDKWTGLVKEKPTHTGYGFK
jgi:DNA primase/KaiC/GvpD/RAD55 family RecA-like ATPase